MNSLRKKAGRPCVRVRQYSVPGASGVTGLPLVGQLSAQEKYSEYYCICYWLLLSSETFGKVIYFVVAKFGKLTFPAFSLRRG